MSDQSLGKYTRGFGLSLAIVIVFNALLVLAKESNDRLMNWMKSVSPHHWVTHGILILALFFILGMVLANTGCGEKRWGDGGKLAKAVVGATILGGILISGFFLVKV